MNIYSLKKPCIRIWAMILRHAYLQFKDGYKIIDAFFWPFYDLVVWGFTGIWFSNTTLELPVVTALVTSIVLWTLMYRNAIEISVNVLEEVWNRSLVNFFATPLNAFEWIVSLMFIAFFRSWLTLLFCLFTAYFLFHVNLLFFGWHFIVSCILLMLNGWIVGFFSAGLIIYWGQKAQAIAWPMAWVLAPFIGVFFPIEILPPLIRYSTALLPPSYIFTTMRNYIATGTFSYTHMVIATGLTLLYLWLSIIFFTDMFERAKKQGLARLSG